MLNAANNGHNSLQQLIRYYTRVLPLKPEVVIYYGAINDVRAEAPAGPWIHMPAELLEAVSERDYLRVTHKDAGFYFRNSLLLHRVKSRIESMLSRTAGATVEEVAFVNTLARLHQSEPGTQATGRSPGSLSSDSVSQATGQWPARHSSGPAVSAIGEASGRVSPFADAAQHFVRNLETMRLICEANGTKFVPVSFLADLDRLPPMYREGLPQLVGALRQSGEADDSGFIDLYPALNREATIRSWFAKDHYHPSREGARFLAHRLADSLR